MKREPTLQLKKLEHRFSSQCCYIYFNFINTKNSKEIIYYYSYKFDNIFKHLLSSSNDLKEYTTLNSLFIYSMDITHFVIATKNNFCNGAIILNNGKLIVFYKYLNYIMSCFNFSIRKGEKINEDSLCDFILKHSNIEQEELYSIIEKNLFKLM